MFTYIHALALGVVEGITEFLPISSTGHLILTSKLLGIENTDFLKSFEIIIQLGAILAVIVLYAKKVLFDRVLIQKIIVAFLPTGILGFILYKLIKQFLLGNSTVVLWSLLVGGIGLIILEKMPKKQIVKTELSYKDAAIIGTIQALAVIPGVSRSAATIIGGMLLGYDRRQVVEFSFLLAIPTMIAASGYDIIKNVDVFTANTGPLLAIGFVTAFVVALVAIKWLLKYVQTKDFVNFGIYRIAVALLGFWLI